MNFNVKDSFSTFKVFKISIFLDELININSFLFIKKIVSGNSYPNIFRKNAGVEVSATVSDLFPKISAIGSVSGDVKCFDSKWLILKENSLESSINS